jgi:hypothetical protein
VQTDSFTTYQIKLEVPYRSIQKEQVVIDMAKKGKRRRIEVLFAQLYGQFRLKLNYAKKLCWIHRMTFHKTRSSSGTTESQP